MPTDAQISNNVLEFGQIKYLQPVTRTVTLENVGQVLAQFKFIPKLQEENYCKPWLWIAPSTGILTPGEKGEITFTVLVDKRSAPALNKKTETIDDILILHLENGKDVFVRRFICLLVLYLDTLLRFQSRENTRSRVSGHH